MLYCKGSLQERPKQGELTGSITHFAFTLLNIGVENNLPTKAAAGGFRTDAHRFKSHALQEIIRACQNTAGFGL